MIGTLFIDRRFAFNVYFASEMYCPANYMRDEGRKREQEEDNTNLCE